MDNKMKFMGVHHSTSGLSYNVFVGSYPRDAKSKISQYRSEPRVAKPRKSYSELRNSKIKK